MQIIVHIAAAKQSITLEIDNSSSPIENVKKVIKNREEGKEIPMDELDLVFQGTILEEGKTVSYYNIQDGSILNTAFQLRGETVQVFLRSLTGKTYSIGIGESDKLDDLKKIVEDVTGYPPDHQRLMFDGQLGEGVILDQMRLIQSRVLESGDQKKIAEMYACNGRPTLYMVHRLRGGGNVVHHLVKWADGSSSPPKKSSIAIKIDDASDENVMNSDDYTSCSSGSSSMNRPISCEKCKRLLFDEEFNSKVVKEVANSLKGDDWDQLTSSLRDVPNISRTRILDALDLFEEKPILIRLFLSLNPEEKEEWLVRKLGY